MVNPDGRYAVTWCGECDRPFGRPVLGEGETAFRVALELASQDSFTHFLVAHPQHPDVPAYKAFLAAVS